MSFGYTMLGFGASQNDAYAPGMMTHNGSSYYEDTSQAYSGNLVTAVARFNVASFSGGSIQRMSNHYGVSGYTRVTFINYSNDHATTANRDKLRVFCRDSSDATICDLLTDVTVCDSTDHVVFFSYSAAAGTAILYIDGVDADDTGYASRVLTTGTLNAGTGATFVGSFSAAAQFTIGDIGYYGQHDVYLTNPTDFYHPTNGLQEIDESGWTEWGSQPLYWNQYGKMDDNKGSAGNMTANGTITGPA